MLPNRIKFHALYSFFAFPIQFSILIEISAHVHSFLPCRPAEHKSEKYSGRKKIKIGNVFVILGLSVPFLWFLHKFPCSLDIPPHICSNIYFLLMTLNTNAKLKYVHHTILLLSANLICSSETYYRISLARAIRYTTKTFETFNNNRYPILLWRMFELVIKEVSTDAIVNENPGQDDSWTMKIEKA